VTGIDVRQFAIYVNPQFQEQPDGTWVAHYPHLDWSVTAASESEARLKLTDEFIRRQSTGPDVDAELECQEKVLRRHFDEPIPGLYVWTMIFLFNSGTKRKRNGCAPSASPNVAARWASRIPNWTISGSKAPPTQNEGGPAGLQ
jgi:hypothetical protein